MPYTSKQQRTANLLINSHYVAIITAKRLVGSIIDYEVGLKKDKALLLAIIDDALTTLTQYREVLAKPDTSQALSEQQSRIAWEDVEARLKAMDRQDYINGPLTTEEKIFQKKGCQPHKIILWPNGNISARENNGEVVDPIQNKGWMQVYFEHLEQQGYDPSTIRFEAMHGDTRINITPFKTEHGWNYNVVKTNQP